MPPSNGTRRTPAILPPPPYELSAEQQQTLRGRLPRSLSTHQRLAFLSLVAQEFGCFRDAIEHPRPRPAETREQIDKLLDHTRALRRGIESTASEPAVSGRVDYILAHSTWRAPAETDAESDRREGDPQYAREVMKLARRWAKIHPINALTAQQLLQRMVDELRQLECVLRLARGPRDPGGRPTADAARATLVKRVAIHLVGLGIPFATSSKGTLGSILRIAVEDIEHNKALSADRMRAIIRRALTTPADRKKTSSKKR